MLGPMSFGALASSAGGAAIPDITPDWQFDASNITSLWQDTGKGTQVSSNGDPVQVAEDLIGSDDLVYVSTAPSYAAAQINGLGTIEMVYITPDDWLRVSLFSTEYQQPNTLFFVTYTSNGLSENMILTDGVASAKRHLIAYDGALDQHLRINAGANLETDSVFDLSSPSIIAIVFNGASSQIWKDGTLLKSGNAGTQGLTGLSLGDNYATTGSYGGFFGEGRIYNRELSESEIVQVSGFLASKWGITVADAITIVSLPSYSVVQRNGSGTGDLVVSGNYYGSTAPTSIEYNIGAGWNTLDSSPSGGAYSGTILGVPGGQYTLQVRFSNGTGITSQSDFVGIGDVFLVAGQSNNSGRGTNSQSYSHAIKAGLFGNNYLWQELADPFDTSSGQTDSVSADTSPAAAGSYIPLLATSFLSAEGVPIAFVPCARGGASISDWQKGADNDRSTLYGSMQYRAGQIRGGVKAILWWQGERDAVLGTAEATYNAALDSFANDVKADLGVAVVACKLPDLSTFGTGYDETAVNNAIAAAWSDNENVLQGPDFSDITPSVDGVHMVTDGELTTAASRWWSALQAAFYT